MTSTRDTPTTHPAPPATAPPDRALLAAAVAAPVVFLAGSVLFPALPRGIAEALPEMLRRQDVLLAGRLLTGVGALLFVCTALVLARAVPSGRPGTRVLRTGLVVVAVGTLGNGASQLVQAYGTEAALDAVAEAGLPPAAAGAVVERIGTGLPGLPLGYWTLLAFGLGWLVVAVGLLRSGTVTRSLPVALAVAVLVGFLLSSPGWSSLAMLPFVVVVVLLVARSARSTLSPAGR